MKNVFLILFYVFGIVYCYGNITNNNILSTIGIHCIVPSIAIYYLFNAKNKNLIYLVALVASYIGDITFYKNDINIDLISLGGFIIFNLLILIIVFEKMRLVKFGKIFIITPILMILFMITTYIVFDTIDYRFLAIGVYFFSLSLLTSFCVQYYRSTKSDISLYFLIGVIAYIIASLTKEFEYINANNTIMLIINASAYLAAHYFYCNAILRCSNEKIETKTTQNNLKK